MSHARYERPRLETAATARTPRTHVVILDITTAGPVYLGNIGCGNQGVSRIDNANRYTERGARMLAALYPRGVAAPADGLAVEG